MYWLKINIHERRCMFKNTEFCFINIKEEVIARYNSKLNNYRVVCGINSHNCSYVAFQKIPTGMLVLL